MMKIRNLTFLAVLIGLSVSTIMPAQNLPALPSDPAVTAGLLPNGMSYFIVENPSVRGVADFALVQRTGTQTSEVDPVAVARESLAGTRSERCGSPQKFFLYHGVLPGVGGFVGFTSNSTVYRFEDLNIRRSGNIVDSTLLVLMDMADNVAGSDDPSVREWYSPSDNAIIVSGDVAPDEIAQKLRIFSYMTPSFPSKARREYLWTGSDEMTLVFRDSHAEGIASVSAVWKSERTPREYMNTIQPMVYHMYVTELGIIAKKRIEEAFRDMDIPVADVTFRLVDSVESLDDESFEVSVTLAEENIEDAFRVLGKTMAALDSGDALLSELMYAQGKYLSSVDAAGLAEVSNAEYVDRCVAAFLYNASIASDKERSDFYISRDLAPETELRLFNGIVSALIDRKENLVLTCEGAGLSENDKERVRSLFDDAWDAGESAVTEEAAVTDTLSLPCPGERMKLRSVRKEHMSDGYIWTFANGFRVAVKAMPAGGKVHYALALNGGYGSVRDLSRGEGAFMSDYFDLCRIGGLDGEAFKDMLDRRDMTLDASINFSNTVISGHVQKDDVEFMLQVLLALMNGREHDEEAYSYYVRSEELRLKAAAGSRRERVAAIDSLMCPDYLYSPHKTVGVLSEGLAAKTDAFLRRQAEKMNDGVLVVAGDVDEVMLKRLLSAYAGQFRTAEKAFPRSFVRYQPVSGWSTYTMDGEANSVDVVMSAMMPLTAEDHAACAVAAQILKSRLSGAVSGNGIHLSLAHECRIYPQERFNMMISLNELPVEGFAVGTDHKNPVEVLEQVRNVLSDMDDLQISEMELDACKQQLKASFAREVQNPEYWIRAISKRYLDGKDFTTSCEDHIESVTAEKVKSLLSSLDKGSKVEYIMIKE